MHRAALLRPVPVLDPLPMANLAGTRVLVLPGSGDDFRDEGLALAAALRDRGADVQADTVAAGHDLAEEDVDAVSRWLAGIGFLTLASGPRRG